MDWDQFSKSLIEFGFFRYLSPKQKEAIPRMLTRIKSTGYIFTPTTYRDYPADEESIGEGGVKTFLLEVKRILKANNVPFTRIIENPTSDAYKISINGEEYILCSDEEFKRPLDEIQHTITKRLFAIINQLLRKAGSEERIYSRSGGNDHWAIFLTHELYNLLLKSDFSMGLEDLHLYEE
jgi:hypothetical protein